jgi:hypothetical protein
MGHVDVNIPLELRPRVGALLQEFKCYLLEHDQVNLTCDAKPSGGHITPWWLHLTMSAGAPTESRLQFGETLYAKVNPVPHLWVRGKARWLGTGVALLTAFMQRTLRRHLARPPPPSTPPPPPMPTRAPPRWTPSERPERVGELDGHASQEDVELTVVADFDGTAYGGDYLRLHRADRLCRRTPPADVDPEGWSFGWHREGGRTGWYPGIYATLDGARAPSV